MYLVFICRYFDFLVDSNLEISIVLCVIVMLWMPVDQHVAAACI